MDTPDSLDGIHRGPWLDIHWGLVSYVRDTLRLHDSSLNKLFELSMEWAEWDILTALANYHSVVEILFGYLTGRVPPDSTRAIAMVVLDRLSRDIASVFKQMISILSDSVAYKRFLSCRGPLAQRLLNLLQELLDSSYESTSRPLLSKALLRLSGACELHPTCFALAGLEEVGPQVAGGGFGDICKGLVGGQTVAVKSMRRFRDDDIKIALKKFGREALIWRQLSHPNLLPFFGIYTYENRLCLVSSWMDNGDLTEVTNKASSDMDRVSLIVDIAMGLEYLHSQHVVHGDLKAANILVTPSGRACIADFGLASVVDVLSFTFTHTSNSHRPGTVRYQAPELLSNQCPNHFGSDVYAFACLCYEILTGRVPFFEIRSDAAVICKVIIEGGHPTRLEIISPADLWLLLEDCWKQNPDERPTMTAIFQRLVNQPIGAQIKQSPSDWDEAYSARFRRSVQNQPLLPSVLDIEKIVLRHDPIVVSDLRGDHARTGSGSAHVSASQFTSSTTYPSTAASAAAIAAQREGPAPTSVSGVTSQQQPQALPLSFGRGPNPSGSGSNAGEGRYRSSSAGVSFSQPLQTTSASNYAANTNTGQTGSLASYAPTAYSSYSTTTSTPSAYSTNTPYINNANANASAHSSPAPGPLPLQPPSEREWESAGGESTDGERPSMTISYPGTGTPFPTPHAHGQGHGHGQGQGQGQRQRQDELTAGMGRLGVDDGQIDGLRSSSSHSYRTLARHMSNHQRTQGYVPGAWGSSLPPAFPPNSTYARGQDAGRTSGNPGGAAWEADAREEEQKPRLRTVLLPQATLPRFLAIASGNTARNLETCGLLLGREVVRGSDPNTPNAKTRYVVETLLIPKQHATSDTCTMDEEEGVLGFTEERGLITLGWIHTHPSQSCFMSSVDLHTHGSFQYMVPESFAVVCAPKSDPSFGIFRLTDPPGLQTVLKCRAKQAFHPHPDVPIYTDADKGHVQMRDAALEIVDLR